MHINAWMNAVIDHDPNFQANFDPRKAVDDALVMKTQPVGTRIKDMKVLDDAGMAALQKDFERAWLAKWIGLGALTWIPFAKDVQMYKVRKYAKKVGLDHPSYRMCMASSLTTKGMCEWGRDLSDDWGLED
jgi:hypothetical protein